jgi:hypothetical protein
VKKIILDENLPHPLRLQLPNHDVVTVQYQGWSGIQNGDLLKLIDGAFDVFITADKNLRYQQNLTGRKVAIIELPFTRFESLLPYVTRIQAAVDSARQGEYIQIQ